MRRLSRAGFKGEFARQAVLPDWWTDECADDAQLLPDIEIRVARFIGVATSLVHDPSATLSPPTYAGAQLRRVRNVSKDRLGPAIHAALSIAGAVVRGARGEARPVRMPPTDGIAWRDAVARERPIVQLGDVLRDLWDRGIAVIQVDLLPSPSFQGLACIVEGRPVVVLGHSLDEPSRLAFIVAHEVGHIVNGDCLPDQPVVDEQEEVTDDHAIELRADGYAIAMSTGGTAIPVVGAAGFKELAVKASKIEKDHGIDAAAVIWSWARRTGDYGVATMAAQALYRTKGGKRALREAFDRNIDLDAASESDRALLRCVVGDPERDAPPV